MANIWFSGAESGDKSEITYSGLDVVSGGRTGSYCYQASNASPMYKDLSGNDELYVQFAFNYQNQTSPSESHLFSWRAGNTILGMLTLDASQIVRAYIGNKDTLVGTFSNPISNSQWVLFELHLKISDVFGAIKVRYNGFLQVDFAGDTKPGSEINIDRLYWSPYSTAKFDDLAINDPLGTVNFSWPNNAKVIRLAPTTDGTTLDWTSTSSDHYSTIDEVPSSDSDYLISSSVDQVDEFVLADLPGEAQTVLATRVCTFARKESSLEPNQIALGVKVGSTTYVSSDFDLNTSYSYVSNIWELNPLTGLSWAPADVNNLQMVLKSRYTPSTGSFTFIVELPDALDFTLPIVYGGGGYVHDFIVDWDDGSSPSSITSYDDSEATHSYSSSGTYAITMTGRCEYFDFLSDDTTSSRDYVTQLVEFTGDMGFKVLNFSYCAGLTAVVSLGTLDALTTASNMFSNCTTLETIPSNLFAGCRNVEDFDYTFANCQALSSIPADLFKYNTRVTTFKGTFGWCYNFPSTMPTDLFRYNTLVTSFYELTTFCPIDTIPDDTFRYNVLVTDFSYVFDHKETLVTIPENLFKYNTLATNFTGAFAENYALENVPADLFQYNTLATNFYRTFYRSEVLASIPADLFKYNVNATNFMDTFYASAIEAVPNDLFKYNVSATNFTGTFYGCEHLLINPYTFYSAGGTVSRFLNQTVDFHDCFYRAAYAGTTYGTAPDLWNCDFGTGSPTTTNCFDGVGNDASSISNYGDIPSGWK